MITGCLNQNTGIQSKITDYISAIYTEIAEVPDIRFNQSALTVNENERTLTICAVAGQLAEEVIPVRVTISAVSGTAMSELY